MNRCTGSLRIDGNGDSVRARPFSGHGAVTSVREACLLSLWLLLAFSLITPVGINCRVQLQKFRGQCDADQIVVSNSLENLTMSYPASSAAMYDSAECLCDFVASGLRVSSVAAFADNSHNLSSYSDDNASVPFSPYSYETYHWWGISSDA